MRYRGAALAELTRALSTLKALQAEQAVPLEPPAGTMVALNGRAGAPGALAPGAPMTSHASGSAPHRPNDSKARREPAPAHLTPNQPEPGGTLHEPAALWHPSEGRAGAMPKEPETCATPGGHAPAHAARRRTSAACAVE